MPVCNEERFLAQTLASIQTQTYPHERLRLIIVDNRSDDRSAAIAREWAAVADIAVEILSNSVRSIPKSLNVAITRVASDEIVVRLDSHTRYGPDYVAAIVDGFARHATDVGCIGGALVPEAGRTFATQLVAALYTNPFGLGGAPFRRATSERFVRDVYLGAWRPGVVQAVGAFDEAWAANEDSELAARVCAAGFRILWIPLDSQYHIKRGPIATIKQWGKYGFWRAQTAAKHPTEVRLRHVIAPVALGAAIACLVTKALRPGAIALYAAYVVAVWSHRSRMTPPLVAAAACVYFPACQVAWTAGLLGGAAAFAARSVLARTGSKGPRV